MDPLYQTLARHTRWRQDTAITQPSAPAALKSLLVDRGSLTAALVAISSGTFEVHVLRQFLATPYVHEQIKMRRPLALIAGVREVELHIFGEPVVFARSIMPLAVAKNGQGGLGKLGQTPLGHLLFKNGRIRVSKRQFAEIDIANHQYHARRTPYDYQQTQILVSEFFLPKILSYL
ncbi:hypothetical protein GCM10008090_24820 [Arenicella chitinivorans]|uniref:Chorismate lyase n=1 Tax=Arenicella chitinivorans TaxID=1329800 RepID=A0A918VMY9_9GAMM|nr:chorismate lyase [Arenicella chitinivorans]GHA14073.1 hypothetical protein GCM10008090_24820 [Arenicella chitinivorans]